MSPAQTPVAVTDTSTSPGPGRGVSHAPTSHLNGDCMMAARIDRSSLAPVPSPGTPGEGEDEGSARAEPHSTKECQQREPSPLPLPAYRARGQDTSLPDAVQRRLAAQDAHRVL